MTLGKLYLIPVPIGDGPLSDVIPLGVLETIRSLQHFVVENARTARAIIKACAHPSPIQSLSLCELNEHTPKESVTRLLAPLLAGEDVGLMSEAGCPGIADPGALLVSAAHLNGISVHPLTGPSSILLGLMASGMTGQRFTFLGYLPARDPERRQALIDLERRSALQQETQIFIETPYRNAAMLETMLAALGADTIVSIASGLSTATETVSTRPVRVWLTLPRDSRIAICDRRPTVFLVLAPTTQTRANVSAAEPSRRKPGSYPRRHPPRNAG